MRKKVSAYWIIGLLAVTALAGCGEKTPPASSPLPDSVTPDSEPNPSIPVPEPSSPVEEPSIPTPEPSTPEPEPSTPEPEPSTPAPDPTKLGMVQELSVVRKDETNFVISFNAVENAGSYAYKVMKEEAVVVEEQAVVSGQDIAAVNDAGVYTFAVRALSGDHTLYLDGDYANFTYTIEDWVDREVEQNKWTCRVEQGKPVSEAKIVYPDGSVYVGSVNDDFSRKEGRHTYPNKMYYEGKFVNDMFEDEDGFFSWSQTDNLADGPSYQGGFKAGTTDGQYGKITYPSFHVDGEGIQWWEGKILGMAEPAYDSVGKVHMKHSDGSWYEGGMLRNANGYVKTGEGRLTYPNKMYYEGEFANDAFNGHGSFNWGEGQWFYEGEFKDGTMAGCTGKLIFDQTNSVWDKRWFIGLMDGFPSYAPNQKGQGCIGYGDYSLYTGDVYVDANKNLIRDGIGTMDGTDANCHLMGEWINAKFAGLEISYYVGAFSKDHNGGWIWGDGVFYFTRDGAPAGYLVGNFDGWAYKGASTTFDESTLLKDYVGLEAFTL